jgi:hypothetical protein
MKTKEEIRKKRNKLRFLLEKIEGKVLSKKTNTRIEIVKFLKEDMGLKKEKFRKFSEKYDLNNTSDFMLANMMTIVAEEYKTKIEVLSWVLGEEN